MQVKIFLPPAKNTKLNRFIHITRWARYDKKNWKENANLLMFLMFLHFTKAATSICLLKKVFTTRLQKTLDFFQWLWLLIIINFIIQQLLAEHWFLKNTYAWLLLTAKFYSEFDSCSVTIKFACCRRDFPSCFSYGL